MTLDQFDNMGMTEIGACWPELRAMVAENERLRAELHHWKMHEDPCHGLGCGHCSECVDLAKADNARLKEIERLAKSCAHKLSVSYSRREVSPRAEFDSLIEAFTDRPAK